MKWLTLTEIGRRARSKKGALEVSYEHWCQLYQATTEELHIEFVLTDGELHKGAYCGLCKYKDFRRYRNCSYCPFEVFCEGRLWSKANREIRRWHYKLSGGDWHKWKRAAKAIRDKLKELMESV